MVKKLKTPPPLSPGQNVSEAFATILRHDFECLLDWEDGARTWADIEGVHQFRVSARRMRSAISLFRSAVPRTSSNLWAEELRWIAGEMGPARDLDVFITQGLSAVATTLPLPGREGLQRRAESRRAEVYQQQVCAMLDSERYRRFKEGFPGWYENRQWERAELRKKEIEYLRTNLVPFGRELMDKQERRVLSAGSHVNREDAAEMHSLRIECKKLRYAAEFFRPLFAGMDVFIAHMKGLQDLLGLMNDVAVTRRLLDQLLTGETDHETLVYAGGFVGWRACDFQHMLGKFDLYWEDFVETRHPWWKHSALIPAGA